jgi:serine protease inhibitor
MDTCTFDSTGKDYVYQIVGQCFDCFTDPHHAICIHCMNKCHKNHHITNIRTANSFCDCPLVLKNRCVCSRFGHNNPPDRYESSEVIHNNEIDYMSYPTVFYPRGIGVTSHNLVDISQPIFDFGFGILRISPNLTVSPYSIFTALSLAQYGSNGETLEQFKNILRYRKEEVLPSIINVYNEINKYNCCRTCNLIFTKTKLHDKYINDTESIVKITNGINVDKINNFVDGFTNHLIPKAISEGMLSGNVALILMNIIYFKSLWEKQFNKMYTKKGKFVSIDEVKELEFMKQESKKFLYTEDGNNQILEMNYKDENFSFGIVLPKETRLLPNINSHTLNGYISRLHETEINKLVIPKFKYRAKFTLNSILQKLGLTDMFMLSRANFSDLTHERVFVDKVIHEIVVIVDEEGTEATAVTSIAYCLCMDSSHHDKVDFIATHPFTYYIRFRPYNLILFLGNFT